MREIPLTQGKVALVDDEDYERLSAFRWHAVAIGGTHYAKRWMRGVWPVRVGIYMHREILGFPEGLEVDHANGSGLDNRRSNLRAATTQQNQGNRRHGGNVCGFRGVARSDGPGYVARIMVSKRQIHLGTFRTKEEAARAYDDAAVKHFGEFARLNFPEREMVG